MTREYKIVRKAFGKLTRFRPDRRVMVFLFFVLISAIFWFLSALGKEYTTRISYPVRYTNFPENMVLVGELPSSLELTVNAYGYTLVRYHISSRLLPIVFDVNSFSLNRMPDTDTRNFFVLSSLAANRISGQLGAGIEVLDIRPDTLFFRFTEMVSRKLPVKPVIEIEFEPQFMIKGIVSVEPDSVQVSGPASIVDTLQFVPTNKVAARSVNKTLTRDSGLSDIDMLSFSPGRVKVSVPVEQFTEATIRIPVDAVNLPDTLTMKIFPADISISYLVALSDYDRIIPQLFRATVDYHNSFPGTARLEVQLSKQPDFIRSVRFFPRSVDYIIER